MQRKYVRTCQECGVKQDARDPATYSNESWRDVKCKNKQCRSEALDYGMYEDQNVDDEEVVDAREPI